MTMFSYRAPGDAGVTMLNTAGLNIAFNRIAQALVAKGAFPADYTKQFRAEGTVKIDRKNYRAIMQAGLIVVEKGPTIPDQIRMKF
jgi:hypothetical protein